MDSILSDSPIKSKPSFEAAHQLDEKPDAQKAEKPDVVDEQPEERSTARASETDADDDSDAEHEPVELNTAGLRKALGASRKEAREGSKRSRELQRQLDQLSGQMQAMQRQPQPAQQPTEQPKDDSADFYADPVAYARRVADERGKQAESRNDERFVRLQRMRIADAQEAIESQHEDGKEMLELFGQLAQQNPALRAEFTAIADGEHHRYRNPVRFALETARTAKRLQGVSSLDDYEKQLRAKWEAERSGQSETEVSPQQPTKTPKSIASSRGSGGAASKAAWSGPRSLSDILGS